MNLVNDVFLDNKYLKWYNSIIEKAHRENRNKDCKALYFESHHIIPKFCGGNNKKENLILLTAKEHFICHWLLEKFVIAEYTKSAKYAISMMSGSKGGRKISSAQFEICRKKAREAKLGNKNMTKEGRKSLSEFRKTRTGNKNPFYGKRHSIETIEKLSRAKKGENHPNYNKKRPEHSEKMKIVMKGMSKTEEHKNNIKLTWHKNRTYITCEHCLLKTTKSMHTRWHGSKCKEIVNQLDK